MVRYWYELWKKDLDSVALIIFVLFWKIQRDDIDLKPEDFFHPGTSALQTKVFQ